MDTRMGDFTIRDLPSWLRPGDALVLNDTRVLCAALEGVRLRGDLRARVAVTLIKRLHSARWLALARPAKRLEPGDIVRFLPRTTTNLASAPTAVPHLPSSLNATVVARGDGGEVELRFEAADAELDAWIARVGDMPLPPYIAGKRPVEYRDRETYQTVFATHDGAVAAPTAGLHFTPELFAALDARGVSRHTVTLHVGTGTFQPVKVDDTEHHLMHAEWGEVPPETAAALNAARARGGRIVAVGTTSLRLLESAAEADGDIAPFQGETAIFITPGYRFRAVDVLMTNFHLPRSTLFMLVAAFSGLETMQRAYAHAIQANYRFYSYGDACLLFPAVDPF